jgi:hypothetical protein
MSLTSFKYRPDLDSGYAPSNAAGVEANALESNLAAVEKKFVDAESLYAQTYREFCNNFLDSRAEGWDGYGALPVADAAFLRSREFLKKCLGRYPAPTSGATPNGSLTFEWLIARDRRFMVSIGADEVIAYAGLFGSSTVRGTEPFVSDVPSTIWAHLNRLYPQ